MENSIFLVEDHPLFSLGLVEIINDEEDMVVCGSSQTVSGALKKIPDINPDIVIVDITGVSKNTVLRLFFLHTFWPRLCESRVAPAADPGFYLCCEHVAHDRY